MRPLHSFPLMLLIIFYHSLPLTSGASVHKMASAVHKMAASVSPVQPIQSSNRKGKMLGLDTGNPEADSEAEMWIMALIGAMAAAAPLAFLNPGLGFKRKRSTDEAGALFPNAEQILNYINNQY